MKPDLPCRTIPDSCGTARCEEFTRLVALYDRCSDDDIPKTIVKMAALLAQTHASVHVPALWETVRAWNAAAQGIKVVSCSRCGEFRAARIEGESRNSQHWEIVGFEPPSAGDEHGLAHPAVVLLAAHECNHQSFRLNCLTCGAEIQGAVVKLVDRHAVQPPAETHVN